MTPGVSSSRTAGSTRGCSTRRIGVAALTVGLSLFLGSSVGSWAVGHVCDSVWDKRVGPALEQLLDRRRDDPAAFWNAWTFRFGVWFDRDKVFVQVVGEIAGGDDGRALLELVPEAFRRAHEWLTDHGIPDDECALIYYVRDAKLDAVPALSALPTTV